MAYTTINKSTDYFNTKLYTGNGSAQSITGLNFQPDWCWLKSRATANHRVFDAVRGATKAIYPSLTSAEGTSSAELNAFNSDGFTLGSEANVNANGVNFASWNWKANGQGSSNTDGSINTTYTSASTTSGFSISTYTGTGANATVGHGLGVAPKMILMKNISTTSSWIVYHESVGNTKSLALDSTAAEDASSVFFNNTSPTSSVFSLGNSNANASGDTCIAYCFAEKKGFSKFGSVKGNGSDDGPFIYTGFKPAFYMHKIYNGSTGQWLMFDNKRNETNVVNKFLKTDSNEAEGTSGSANQVDFLSNGIKIRENNGDLNSSTSNDYLYMAFAEAPLVGTNNVPTTAR